MHRYDPNAPGPSNLPLSQHITPSPSAAHVVQFCADVSPDERPVLARSLPRMGVVANECFANARAHVDRWGGSVVLGWAIWEVRGLMLDAEFHAMWRSKGGALVDVNPRPSHDADVLFLSQPGLTHEGVRRDNIRVPLLDDLAVHAFIDQAARRVAFMERHTVPGKPHEVRCTEAEWAAAFPNEVEINTSFFRLVVLHRREKDPCVCGKPRQFRKCHRNDLLRQIAEKDPTIDSQL
jgi:hypothetical protein